MIYTQYIPFPKFLKAVEYTCDAMLVYGSYMVYESICTLPTSKLMRRQQQLINTNLKAKLDIDYSIWWSLMHGVYMFMETEWSYLKCVSFNFFVEPQVDSMKTAEGYSQKDILIS